MVDMNILVRAICSSIQTQNLQQHDLVAILLLLNEITYKKVHMHFMQICLAITPTYIPQVNKYSFRRIYSVGPVGFLNAAQFVILIQRFSQPFCVEA
jgi:hypothetical protein